MDKEKILKKAIEKAKKESPKFVGQWKYADSIIFSHDFARAFWGEEAFCTHDEIECERNPVFLADCLCHRDYAPESWEHHLQRMVLEEDPIKYLEKFL